MESHINPLREKINIALNNKFYANKESLKVADFIAPFSEDVECDKNMERKLERKIEVYGNRLNDEYLKEFERVNDIVQKFDEIAHKMNKMCLSAYEKVEIVKNRSSDLLNKSVDLKRKRDFVQNRIDQFSDFLDSTSISPEDENELYKCEQSGKLSSNLFEVLKRAEEIRIRCRFLVQEQGHAAAFQVLEEMQFILDRGQCIILENIKRDYKNISIDSHRLEIIRNALAILRKNETIFQITLEQLSEIRSNEILHTFMQAGSKMLGTNEHVGSDMTTVHDIAENEKEFLESLLENDEKLVKKILNETLSSLAAPLKVNIEKFLAIHNEPLSVCKLAKILTFYSNKFSDLLFENNNISKVIDELVTLAKQVFLAGLHHRVDHLNEKMRVPCNSLASLPEIHLLLKLFNEILELTKESGFFNDEDIYEIIVEPLVQNIQLVSIGLKSDLEVSIFIINCLSAIKDSITNRESSFFVNRLEKLSAMIEGNEDVLVSMQVSEMVRNFGIGDIYDAIVRNENKKPLSEIVSIDEFTQQMIIFSNSILVFSENVGFSILECISDNKERTRISNRNISEFIKVYQLVIDNIENPENKYGNLQYLPVENVKKMLVFDN